MEQYKELVQKILRDGATTGDRTGTGTVSMFGHQMRFDLTAGFPLVTMKKTIFKGMVVELLWILRGDTNIQFLRDHNVKIWDEWCTEDGDLGPIYGAQFRSALALDTSHKTYADIEVDQLVNVLHSLKHNPNSRRHIINCWNLSELPDESKSPQQNVKDRKMALAPCHTLVQFHVTPAAPNGKPLLSCQLYQRSADVVLGVPVNIASYSLLTHMIAYHLDYEVGEFIWSGGDCHIYSNHMDQVHEMLQRKPLPLPTIKLNYPPETSLWEVEPHQIELIGYQHHPAIKAPVAV